MSFHSPYAATLLASVNSLLNDDVLLRFGDGGDQVLLNRSTALNANTALTNVLIGTPVTPALAANSLIISDITASGDLLLATNLSGNAIAAFWADGSSGDRAVLAASGASIDHYIAGTKVLDHASAAFAFQEATTISTTAGALTLTPTTDVVISNGLGLLVGDATRPSNYGMFSLVPEVQVLGTGYNDGSVALGVWSTTDTQKATLIFFKSANATIGNSSTVPANGEDIGLIEFAVADGTDNVSTVAEIVCEIDGAPGSNDTPGRLMFFTTSDGAQTATERWRITAAGVLTSVNAAPSAAATADGSVLATGGISFTDVANAWIDDATHGSGTVVHYIGNNTIDTTSVSDARLKEEFLPYSGTVMASIKQLDFSTFLFKPDGLRERFGRTFGITAQTMQGVFPEYVSERTDGFLQNDYNRMIPVTLRGLQEHELEIEVLKTKLAALESLLV